jgi:uncharacterized C2H2 Zn-finger protein
LNLDGMLSGMPYVEYDEVEAVCPECGRIFRSEDALEVHQRESHMTLAPAPPPTASVRTRKKGTA